MKITHKFGDHNKVVKDSPHNYSQPGQDGGAKFPPAGGGPSASLGGGMDASGGAAANYRDGGDCYADGKFIQKAIKHPGALHHDLHVPEGQKIPAGKLASAAAGNYGPKTEQRAHLAQTMRHFDDGGVIDKAAEMVSRGADKLLNSKANQYDTAHTSKTSPLAAPDQSSPGAGIGGAERTRKTLQQVDDMS